ncbi:hypothetical protein pipiens_018411 [Culex pipiens pipiens]|uniref:Proteasome subunit beta n=1 Tax=Culex pipiens pipiens TaxID=38569 RepID=A0ABD1CBW3_CULPP
MALADVCGFSSGSLLAGGPMGYQSFQRDIALGSQNLENSLSLAVPPFQEPAENLAKLQAHGESSGIKMDFDHGTTTLGFRFQGGVILAVDSRATGGQFIGSQTMKKIVEINDYLLGTLAGGAADCVYWDRVLAKECRIYELRNKERISVAAASKIMSNIVYYYKGMGLSMGMMLAGYDKRGPQLGSIYAYGVLDSGYRWDLSDEDAQDLGRRAIYHATHRDAYSGGIVRVYHIKPTGWVNISNQDCMDLHFKYQDEKKQKFGS